MTTFPDETDAIRPNPPASVPLTQDVNSRQTPYSEKPGVVVNSMETNNDAQQSALTVDRETVRAYLTEMYLGVPGLLQVWTMPHKGSGEFFETTEDGIDQAVDSIEASYKVGGQQSIYARITTMKHKPADPKSRGYAIDSHSFIGLWTDVDFGTVGHEGKNLPPDAAAAQAVYDRSGLPDASITVHSGGGLYHIVKLAEPLDIRDDEIRMRIKALSRRWHYKVQDAAKAMGYTYGTGASDLARVLRIPGTINAKDWNNRRRTAYMPSGVRYTLEQLEDACPAPAKPARLAPMTGEPAKDARARLEHHLAEMRATTFERNNALNRLAYMSFQYVAAGQLTEEEVEREFITAGLDAGLEDRETHATVNSAKAGLQKPFVWRDLTSPRKTAEPVDMWAGQLDESGHVADPKMEIKREEPKQESTAQMPLDPLTDLAGPLTDTRLPSITGPLRTSSDKHPYKVATQLRDTFYLHNGKPTLMRWQDMWVRWDGTCWNTMTNDDVTAWLYQRMDNAYHVTKTDGEFIEMPWTPTNSNINNLDKALRAAVNLRDDTQQNTMIGDGVHDLAISCSNGLLRVTGRELAPADPSFFTFSSVPFAYDRSATCPQWITWLEETFAHDPATIDMLQEWFGYVISGRTDLQKALMLQGPERSGKGTIARILQMLAGLRNCCGPTLNSLTEQFGMWALTDKTLAVIGDARLPKKGTEVITERLLSIIGEDTIQVDRKYQKPWQGKIPARLMLLSNEIPNWSDSSGILPTRWIIATTAKSYLNSEDTTLASRLSNELPGILNWALDGLDRLIIQGRFTTNEATPEIVGAQRDRSAPQKGFIEEMCSLGEDKWVTKDRLREMWASWNRSHGRGVTDTRESFTTKLLAMVPTIKAKNQKKRIDGKLVPIYKGVGLLIDYPEEEPQDKEDNGVDTLPGLEQTGQSGAEHYPPVDETDQPCKPTQSPPSAPTSRTPSTASWTGTRTSTTRSSTATEAAASGSTSAPAPPTPTGPAMPPSSPSEASPGPERPPS